MNHQDIVPIQIPKEISAKQIVGNPTNKLAVRLKQKNGSEVFIYNGVNNYILQAVLKEGLSGAS
ncbi:MAG: hypothetical protein L0I88_05720 [Alkalibacterium sp.]|jgi:hypothetical protein|uniref:Uncharacterized protein n=1 Tax=Enterococcus camelliae TaxID=453959 RepID=A0ABW5TKD7_9ENTE|nr:hypothetical protein [Enterococcus italicus]EEP3061346.1 hypothetical protein [Listeria monocytogenes]MDN6194518.1 hypothetical protein [Alkalibacterium sp.]MDN6318055.1 hypothetical protein [Lactococcus lactis]MDN6409129.1 hypothetical protein [Tetragenococcus halophilus]MCM6880693.1 hypothetical protein [Enterococcus italicus]